MSETTRKKAVMIILIIVLGLTVCNITANAKAEERHNAVEAELQSIQETFNIVSTDIDISYKVISHSLQDLTQQINQYSTQYETLNVDFTNIEAEVDNLGMLLIIKNVLFMMEYISIWMNLSRLLIK